MQMEDTCYYNFEIGSQLKVSAAHCDQILLIPLYLKRAQNTSIIWIIRLLLSLKYRPKVILLRGGYYNKYIIEKGKSILADDYM